MRILRSLPPWNLLRFLPFLILFLATFSLYTIYITDKENRLEGVPLQDLPFAKKTPEKACIVPKLDPFDKEVMKYNPDPDIYDCSRKSYGRLDNGVLTVKASGVRDVYFRYILRPLDNDFGISFSPLSRVKETLPKKKQIQIGMVGCLVSHSGEIFGIKSKPDGAITLDSMEEKHCFLDNFLHISSEGQLEAFSKGKCLAGVENCEDDCLFMFNGDCGKNSSTFQFLSDGFVRENITRKCLEIKKESNGNNTALHLVKNCSETSKWDFIDFPITNFDVTKAVEHDFVELQTLEDKSIHTEYLISVKEKDDVLKRVRDNKNKTALPYSVAILVLDSQSASNVERNMPLTFKTLKNDPNSVMLKGHTVVGDGTTAQLSALLVGALEENLPEARRSMAGAQSVDRWPFIFKDFVEKRYVTFYNEDYPGSGSFNYRLHGFKKQPTDHYSRHFWLTAQRNSYCAPVGGSSFVFDVNLNYTLSFYKSYKGIPKFSTTIFSTIFHDHMSNVHLSDRSISNFITEMTTGISDETILVIMGDHGPRTSRNAFRTTILGKLEERLPFLSLTLPSGLIKRHPEFKAALEHNSNGLTSHFDIHATLHHLLSFPEEQKVAIGQSLFTKIDQSNRTCASAGVKEFWCPCLQFSALNTNDTNVLEAANAVVDYINDKIIRSVPDAKSQCRLLELDDVIRAGKRAPNTAVQRFQGTRRNNDCDECGISYGQAPANEKPEFEVVFRVKESSGIFEARVTKDGKLWTVDKEIGRLNLYGDQPKCVAKNYPHLRKFCYCKSK